jgi:hypothetical protein
MSSSLQAGAVKKVEAPHQLSLKVMRLAKPALSAGLHLSEEADEMLSVDSALKLAAAFGEIYLGETFSCYLTLHNSSSETVSSVVVKAELQTTSKRYMLLNQEAAPIASLVPDQCEDSVLHRVICDEGVHILVCTASYLTATMGRRSFRKFFKFNVTQPFSLSHRQEQCPPPVLLHLDDAAKKQQQQQPGDVAIETELENNTPTVLCVTGVRLVCNEQHFALVAGDSHPGPGGGHITYVPPSCCVQFVHRLRPLRDAESGAFPAANCAMGYLELSWARGWGETGTILSPPLVYTPPARHAVFAEFDGLPQLVAGRATAARCKISNLHHYDVQRVRVHLVNEAGSAVVVTGLSGIDLPPLPPRQSTMIEVMLLPMRPGMQQLGKLVLESESESYTCTLGHAVINE